ncbi:BMP family protein [Paenibacillus sp. GD4]|jgi:basic membrane protein A and related proteins|uniref:BMP family protein n=1 Tax=Paenibacillus sp. GD4 TaxID=3068890 RepID=UPI002796CC0F|nr:BMP family protein [Paenibacillus sp. GD4]MDQ1910431.1 BMP family protein [Paenibacillus sp. GD4]
MKKGLKKLTLAGLAATVMMFSTAFSWKEPQQEHSSLPAQSNKAFKVALLLPGNAQDGGFMESAYQGLMRAQQDFGVQVTYKDKVPHDTEKLSEALRELAKTNPDMIIGHAGQSMEAVNIVSKEFPKIKFVNTQTNLTGENVSSYQVLQEESAWLAGAAAGLLTKTNTVGHISGAKVTPGFKGRAAFADGLKYTNPNATFLTTFTGNQDNAELAKRVALAQIESGADMIFTMLNMARQGVIDANRETGTHQFGNVRDYYNDAPDVFIGSAVSDASRTVYSAIQDLVERDWKAGSVVLIGLEDSEAVRLALSPEVPQEVKDKIEELSQKIRSGEIVINLNYTGPEFTNY